MDELLRALQGGTGTGMMGNMPGQITNNLMPGETHGMPNMMPGRVDSTTAEVDETVKPSVGNQVLQYMAQDESEDGPLKKAAKAYVAMQTGGMSDLGMAMM